MTQQHLNHKPPPYINPMRLKLALVLPAVLLLMFALLAVPTGASADDPTGNATADSAPAATPTLTPTTYTIGGTVRDHQGTPVANVVVEYTVNSVASAAQSEPAPHYVHEVGRDGETSGQTANPAPADSAPQSTSAIAFTDAQGRYTLTVSANTYQIKVSRYGYFAPPPQIVTVPPSRNDVDFTFLTPHTIAGYVRDSDGNPIVDADVTRFTSLFDFGFGKTDASGHYSLTVAAGDHRIGVMKAGYLKPTEITITVPPSRSDVDFTLPKCSTGNSAALAPCYHWAGTTDAGRITMLDVLADGATWTNFKLSTRATAGPCSLTITTTLFSSGNILNSQFGSSGGSFAFTGQFSDPNTASGTYQYNEYIYGCGFLSKLGTWTASGALPAPLITRQPLSQTVAQGAPVTVSVAAIGSPPLRYQWHQGQRGDTSTPLAGATTPTYTIFSLVSPAHFWVRVTSAQGLSTDSEAALVTVVTPPTATHTPTPTPSPTISPTATLIEPDEATPTLTPTEQSPEVTPLGGAAYLSIIMQAPPTPTPTDTPTPTATPTQTPTSRPTSNGANRPPAFPQPMSIQHRTSFLYGPGGQLIGATTEIELVTPPVDPDGDPLTYTWSATNGSITGNGVVATWQRLISAGRAQDGTVTVVVSDGRGGEATYRIIFN